MQQEKNLRWDWCILYWNIFLNFSCDIEIKNLHYQIFKFVIDNSDISLNCLQHIQKRRNFDAKVTCHQPICLLLHAILSGVGVGNARPARSAVQSSRGRLACPPAPGQCSLAGAASSGFQRTVTKSNFSPNNVSINGSIWCSNDELKVTVQIFAKRDIKFSILM